MIKLNLRRAIFVILISALIVVLLHLFVIQPFVLFSENMLPTLKTDRVYFINKIIYKFKAPERGDIIVFRTNETPPLYFIKRVVALPGEKVRIKKGRVFINGKVLDEPYAVVDSTWRSTEEIIKEDTFWCLDDDRTLDLTPYSRIKVSYKNIVGKVMR